MNWGKGIIVAFVLFAVLVAILVSISMKQDVNLVSKNYYQEELAYQELLDRKNNTEKLQEKPAIKISNGQLEIYFPFTSYIEEGDVKLFRPSNEQLDQYFKLNPSADSLRIFKLKSVEAGAYRVKLSWRMEGHDYYVEKVVVL